MTQQEWIEKLIQEGYVGVSVCSNEPNTEFPEHTHEETTVHVILDGELTLHDPDGAHVLHVGERFEIPAGKKHSALCGPQGCTFVVGTKKQ